MPRKGRASAGGVAYHVLNRGNGRAEVFHKDGDYQAFLDILGQSLERVPMRVLSYCLMPNHFHLVVWPRGEGDLSRWMQWVMTSHVRRYHSHYGGSGHVWQGRFKSFPVQRDEHLVRLCRYVERNPLRRGLVKRAEAWPWSSLRWWGSRSRPKLLSDWPVDRPRPGPRKWVEQVNAAETAKEVEALRRSVNRGTPLGNPAWVRRTALALSLESTLRPRGRPRKDKK